MQPGFECKVFIHWHYDADTRPQDLPGVRALNDQKEEWMGGFPSIPGLLGTYDTREPAQPENRDHFKTDTYDFKP